MPGHHRVVSGCSKSMGAQSCEFSASGSLPRSRRIWTKLGLSGPYLQRKKRYVLRFGMPWDAWAPQSGLGVLKIDGGSELRFFGLWLPA